jgi:hypothetical protein
LKSIGATSLVNVTSLLAVADAPPPAARAIKNTAAAIAGRPLSMSRFEIMPSSIQRRFECQWKGLSISLFLSIVIKRGIRSRRESCDERGHLHGVISNRARRAEGA